MIHQHQQPPSSKGPPVWSQQRPEGWDQGKGYSGPLLTPLLPRMSGLPGPPEYPPTQGGPEQAGSTAAVSPGEPLSSNPAEAALPAGVATQEAATGPQAGEPPTIPAWPGDTSTSAEYTKPFGWFGARSN